MHASSYYFDYLTPHFTRAEMACRHCGTLYDWPEFMAALEAVRIAVGQPVRILSGHRCALHNARIGGAPLSQHLRLAADVDLRSHDRRTLVSAARAAGFTGFGYYQTFLHIDMGPSRRWYGSERVRKLWQAY